MNTDTTGAFVRSARIAAPGGVCAGRPKNGTNTPPGAAILALRTKAPVVSVFIRRRPEGGHLVTFEPIPIEGERVSGQVLALTARFTAAIEAAIRKSPSEWVWWHERWRRQPE